MVLRSEVGGSILDATIRNMPRCQEPCQVLSGSGGGGGCEVCEVLDSWIPREGGSVEVEMEGTRDEFMVIEH
jgi:hypothetical protein